MSHRFAKAKQAFEQNLKLIHNLMTFDELILQVAVNRLERDRYYLSANLRTSRSIAT